MKNSKLLILLLSLFLCSCGLSPNADTPQLKAWVLMENIDFERDLKNDFISHILAEENIAQLHSEYLPVELYGEQDTYMANPWRVLLEINKEESYVLYVWNLDRTKTISNNRWIDTIPYHYYNNPQTMEEAYNKAEEWISTKDKNEIILSSYVFLNKEEAEVVREAVGRAYVDYIYQYADESVSMKDWEICDYATTKSCTGYYVTYEIGDDFYVLLRYVEEDEDSGFQIKQLYAGDSIVELEQAMQSDMYYATY